MTDWTTVTVRPEDKQAFAEVVDVVAEELDEDVTHSEALREVSEAYLGRDACGQWREVAYE